MEFYGRDLHSAVPAIVEVKDTIDALPDVKLAGLEHLDDRYIKAVSYSPKASRGQLPRMLLLADIVSDSEDSVAAAAASIVRIINQRDGEGFIAVSKEARERFWAARSRTAAIAAHTNAFKINEDVVIPLSALAVYSEGIERINIVQSIRNKLENIDALCDLFQQPLKLQSADDTGSEEQQQIDEQHRAAAQKLIESVAGRWRSILERLDQPLSACTDLIDIQANDMPAKDQPLIQAFLLRSAVVSLRAEVERPLKELFTGRRYQALRDQIDTVHTKARAGRLLVVLHAHAGDGNVHSNIPVTSDDYHICLLYTSPSPRDRTRSRMPSSA